MEGIVGTSNLEVRPCFGPRFGNVVGKFLGETDGANRLDLVKSLGTYLQISDTTTTHNTVASKWMQIREWY